MRGAHHSNVGAPKERKTDAVGGVSYFATIVGIRGFPRFTERPRCAPWPPDTMALRDVLLRGISEAGFTVIGAPDMAVLAFTTPGRDVGAVAEWLEQRGWWMDRQAHPPAIHLVVTPNHVRAVGAFVRDLRAAARAGALWCDEPSSPPRVSH